jgi:hypothetical protein
MSFDSIFIHTIIIDLYIYIYICIMKIVEISFFYFAEVSGATEIHCVCE